MSEKEWAPTALLYTSIHKHSKRSVALFPSTFACMRIAGG
jgi:hypothetical protein